MSLIPIDTVQAYRRNTDMLITIYGIPCELYIPTNVEQRERLDVYEESPNLQYNPPVESRVFIEWKPSSKRLRSLGVFVEDELPVIAWLRGDYVINRNSYMRITINYGVGENQDEEYELVDRLVKNAYDASIVECWRIAPRRKR